MIMQHWTRSMLGDEEVMMIKVKYEEFTRSSAKDANHAG